MLTPAGVRRRDQNQVSSVAVEDEHLRAGQRPSIAGLPAASSVTPGLVPATVLLAQRERADLLTAREARQVLLFGGVVPGEQQRVRGEDAGGEVRRAQQRPAHLFQHDTELEEAEARPAVLLGNGQALQPELLTHLLPELGLVAFGGVHQPAYFALRRLVFQEAAYRTAQLLLFVAESKVHGRHPRAASGSGMTRAVSISTRAVDVAQRTPADALRLAETLPGAVVLTGRWDAGEVVLAADPIEVRRGDRDPFAALDQLPVVDDAEPKALGGGWFGWFGFEPSSHALGFYPNLLRYCDGQWWDDALVGIVDDATLERRRRALVDALRGPVPPKSPYRLGPVTPNRGLAEHAAAVERCIQHIRAGEIYQANICLTLSAPFAGSAAGLAADLLPALEPRYGAYLAVGDTHVVSASPELFLRRQGNHVLTQPIKGTRPRRGDGAAGGGRTARRIAEGPRGERDDRRPDAQRPLAGGRGRHRRGARPARRGRGAGRVASGERGRGAAARRTSPTAICCAPRSRPGR